MFSTTTTTCRTSPRTSTSPAKRWQSWPAGEIGGLLWCAGPYADADCFTAHFTSQIEIGQEAAYRCPQRQVLVAKSDQVLVLRRNCRGQLVVQDEFDVVQVLKVSEHVAQRRLRKVGVGRVIQDRGQF